MEGEGHRINNYQNGLIRLADVHVLYLLVAVVVDIYHVIEGMAVVVVGIHRLFENTDQGLIVVVNPRL